MAKGTSLIQARVFVQDSKTKYFAQMDGTTVPSLTLFPVAPTVTYITGSCVNNYKNCVTGSKITLHGTNFIPKLRRNNRVNIENMTGASC